MENAKRTYEILNSGEKDENYVTFKVLFKSKLKTQSFTMSCRHCTTVVSSSSWPTCRLSSPPRRSSTQRLPRWRSLKLWMRILSFSAKEIFSVCKKMTWKGRGSLHDLLIHHLSLCVGEAKTGGCSSAKIWELMLTVVGKQVHVPDLYHQGCTLCTWCSRCCMILSGYEEPMLNLMLLLMLLIRCTESWRVWWTNWQRKPSEAPCPG